MMSLKPVMSALFIALATSSLGAKAQSVPESFHGEFAARLDLPGAYTLYIEITGGAQGNVVGRVIYQVDGSFGCSGDLIFHDVTPDAEGNQGLILYERITNDLVGCYEDGNVVISDSGTGNFPYIYFREGSAPAHATLRRCVPGMTQVAIAQGMPCYTGSPPHD